MKRMIDFKDYEQVKQTSQQAKEEAENAQADIDRLSQVYTYATLEIEDGYFDMIDPASTVPDQGPVNLAIGDTIYIDGEATTLNAEKIAELFDANNLVLKCGNDPTHYPTVILQRQYIDNAAAGIDESSARFEAFVTLNSGVYHYTLNATRYDETTEQGGAILIACTQAHVKPIYFHPVYLRRETQDQSKTLRCSFFILNNSPTPFTYSTFIAYIKNLMDNDALIQANGVITGDTENTNIFVATKTNNQYLLVGNNTTQIINEDIDSYTREVSFADGINKIN